MDTERTIETGPGWRLNEVERTREGVLNSVDRELVLRGPEKESEPAVAAYLKEVFKPRQAAENNLERCQKSLEAIKANPVSPEHKKTAERGLQALHRATKATAPTPEQKTEAALEAGFEWHKALAMFATRDALHGRHAKKAAKEPRKRPLNELQQSMLTARRDWLEEAEEGPFSAFWAWLEDSGEVYGLDVDGEAVYGFGRSVSMDTARRWQFLKNLKPEMGD